MHPDEAEWGNLEMLMAGAVDALNWLVWAKTKDGSRNRNQPEPIKRPGVEPKIKRVKGQAVPIDQFRSKMADLRARLKSSTAEEEVRATSVRREKEKANGR